MTPPTPSFAEECEQAAREFRNPPPFTVGKFGVVQVPDTILESAADLLTRAAAMARQQAAAQKIVDEQAGNEGLWFYAVTASEGYLQQELRALHVAVEGTSSDAAIAAQDAKKEG